MKDYIQNLWKGNLSLKHVVLIVIAFNVARVISLPILAVLGSSEREIEINYWLFNLMILPVFIITHKALSEICIKSSLAISLLIFSSLSYFVEITMLSKLFE